MKNFVYYVATPDKNDDHRQDQSTLTTQDWLTISKIVIGCSKVVYDSYRYVERTDNRLKKLANTSKKEIAFLSSIDNVIKMKENQVRFRPSNLRRRFPENLQNIQAADLTHILNKLENYSVIEKTGKKGIRKRRGVSSRRIESIPEEPGVKSYYQPTEQLDVLKKVIYKPEARKVIYSLLMESNVELYLGHFIIQQHRSCQIENHLISFYLFSYFGCCFIIYCRKFNLFWYAFFIRKYHFT